MNVKCELGLADVFSVFKEKCKHPRSYVYFYELIIATLP